MRKLLLAFVAVLLICIAACGGGELMTDSPTEQEKLDSAYKTMEPIARIKAMTLDMWKIGVFSDTSQFVIVDVTADTIFNLITDLSKSANDSILYLISKYSKEITYIQHFDSVIVSNIHNYKINIGAVKKDDNPNHSYTKDDNRKYTLLPDPKYTDDSIRHMSAKMLSTVEYSTKLDALNSFLLKHKIKSELIGYSTYLRLKRKNTDSVIYRYCYKFNKDFSFNKKTQVQP